MRPERIVVIGASAGGFAALRRLFSELDPALPAAVLAVLHTGPELRNFAPIVGKYSKLPVMMAEDGRPLEQGAVYLAVPGRHLMLEGAVMRLLAGPKENRARPSIDVLFRSAAAVYEKAVIGVVLTGLLDDGTAGLFYIKHNGGTAIVQDPNDAEFKGMPLNACNNVEVDYVLPLDQIPSLVNRLAQERRAVGSGRTQTAASSVDAITDEDVNNGKPTLYTCPECHGPLMEMKEGSLTRFRCRLGHAYGLVSFLASQTETTEALLWTALQSLKVKSEVETILRDIAKKNEDRARVGRYEKQLADSRRALDILEEVMRLSSTQQAGD